MKLIDEENHSALSSFDLGQDRVQACREFTRVLRVCGQRIQIETEQGCTAQALGDIFGGYSQGQSLGDLGSQQTAFANQHRVIVFIPTKNLDSPVDWLKPAFAGLLGQVGRIA